MPIWLPAALLAGLFQAWRTALQHRLRSELTVNGAGLVRYAYGLPVALVLTLGYLAVRGIAWPAPDVTYLAWAAGAGLAQILGTALLILAFGFRNFVVGTAFAKTETVQAAVFAWLVLGERLTALVGAGIAAGVVGVLVLALGDKKLGARDLLGALGQPAALCGLGTGALFSLTGVMVKRSTIHLDMADPVAAALVTLTTVLALQTAMLGGWVLAKEPGTLRRIVETWRSSSQVGLLAALGSACWFTGFATAPVALVRVVGQVEVLFTLGFSRLMLRERIRSHEVVGLLLVTAGVVLALLGALG
ncbi:MAG: EamA family transporter [Burkholderiales bacterium]|jgi:drug/metabolite transporter (DMT)-like permease